MTTSTASLLFAGSLLVLTPAYAQTPVAPNAPVAPSAPADVFIWSGPEVELKSNWQEFAKELERQ